MDALDNEDVPDMPVAAATPPMRTPRSQKTPIQKEALVRQTAADIMHTCQLGKRACPFDLVI